MTKKTEVGGWTGTAAIWRGSEGAQCLVGRRVKNPRKLRDLSTDLLRQIFLLLRDRKLLGIALGQVPRPPEAEYLDLDYGSNTS